MSVTMQELRNIFIEDDSDDVTASDINVIIRLAKECNLESSLMINRCKPVIAEMADKIFAEEAENDPLMKSFTQFEKDVTTQGLFMPFVEHMVKKSFDLVIDLHNAKKTPEDIVAPLNATQDKLEESLDKASEILEEQGVVIAMTIHAAKYPSDSQQSHSQRLRECIQGLQKTVKAAICKAEQSSAKPKALLAAFCDKQQVGSSVAKDSQAVAFATKLRPTS